MQPRLQAYFLFKRIKFAFFRMDYYRKYIFHMDDQYPERCHLFQGQVRRVYGCGYTNEAFILGYFSCSIATMFLLSEVYLSISTFLCQKKI